MRLINTETYELEDLSHHNVPEYAILSHTWGDEEVTFQEMIKGNDKDSRGYAKILASCRLAQSRDIRFLWVDTCCIDKSSSAELTESINSMFRYYLNAEECYAYLEDCLEGDDFYANTKSCRWWTRGWTLQELIAPVNVLFYDAAWQCRGTKAEHAGSIKAICGIPEVILGPEASSLLEDFSIAARMSWASSRMTTRIEDVAYCLLGLFGVNMPLIYGEGENAFTRLLEEIAKRDNDLTLLASCKTNPSSNLLASCPSAFIKMASLNRLPYSLQDFSLTNRGLRFAGQCPLRLCGLLSDDGKSETRALVLSLGYKGELRNVVGMALRKVGPRLFRRDQSMELISFADKKVRLIEAVQVTDMYILTEVKTTIHSLEAAYRRQTIRIPRQRLFELEAVVPQNLWDYEKRMFLKPVPLEWVRYEMVLAATFVCEKPKMRVLVLIDYTSQPPMPKIMALTGELNHIEATLFQQRNSEDSVSWTDIKIQHPGVARLSSAAMSSMFQGRYKVTVCCKHIERDNNRHYDLLFDISNTAKTPRLTSSAESSISSQSSTLVAESSQSSSTKSS